MRLPPRSQLALTVPSMRGQLTSADDRLRFFLGAFGDPGHVFPMLALGSRLSARGHVVMLETAPRWRAHVETAGMEFVAAPDYPVFPTRERPLEPYELVVQATQETQPALAGFSPDVVVHDILTLAPAMGGELQGVPVATLVPHLHPSSAPGFPPYALGARLPRTSAGSALWRRLSSLTETGLRVGRTQLNDARTRLGLPPVERLQPGISAELCLLATFPQLEYPRDWPREVKIVGPLVWEPPHHDVEPPPGATPLVLIAPSTSQDPDHRLLRAAILGLAHEPVRVLAPTNSQPIAKPVPVPANARLVDWLSYSRTMPSCALVVTHVGHGTLAHSLAAGCPVVAVPYAGDMAENAARADWAGVGVRLPWRFLTPTTLRLAVRRALPDASLARRAGELAAWAADKDAAGRAAELVEALALSRRDGRARTRSRAERAPGAGLEPAT
jgi:UDP:flavonoid glycosyltransferase YjiC (YdhE family)